MCWYKTIKIADGSLAPIARKGKISPCARLSLPSVLHSRIAYNLLSTSKVTHELNSKTTFLPDSVFFSGLKLEKDD